MVRDQLIQRRQVSLCVAVSTHHRKDRVDIIPTAYTQDVPSVSPCVLHEHRLRFSHLCWSETQKQRRRCTAGESIWIGSRSDGSLEEEDTLRDGRGKLREIRAKVRPILIDSSAISPLCKLWHSSVAIECFSVGTNPPVTNRRTVSGGARISKSWPRSKKFWVETLETATTTTRALLQTLFAYTA